MKSRPLYMVKGTLKVEARGYWFTAGGDKGSFGYYPHLKNAAGFPIYPDTQIHGDLRMAATWLEQLEGLTDPADSLVPLIFGYTGGQGRALLKETDLRLSAPAQARWKKTSFQIKSRIRINDAVSVVDKHFLVNREMAWMGAHNEPMELEADLYLGYVLNRSTLDDACRLLCESLPLLSGFGAFRTRGSGRGPLTIKWDDVQKLQYDEDSVTTPAAHNHYFIRSLINVRNRPVTSGSNPQTVATRLEVGKEQLRGWFIDTYHQLFDSWLTLEELAGINFPVLYPSDGQQLAYPPAMTTLRNENKEVADLCGRNPKPEEEVENTFFQTKTKPLPLEIFVTDSDPVTFIRAKIEERFRNVMEENRFQTKKDGLFVQQLVRQGTWFGGAITFEEPNTTFAKRAGFIFSQVAPIINGTFFSPALCADTAPVRPPADCSQPALLTAPINYNHQAHAINPARQISLTVQRCYSTQLNRPRRNRMLLAPGSILTTEEKATLPWQGLGGETLGTLPPDFAKNDATSDDTKDRDSVFTLTAPFNYSEDQGRFVVISRAQAGEWLRNKLLHPDISDPEKIRNYLSQLFEKADEAPLAQVCKAALVHLSSSGVNKCKQFIHLYLEELDLYHWDRKQSQLKKQEDIHGTE